MTMRGKLRGILKNNREGKEGGGRYLVVKVEHNHFEPITDLSDDVISRDFDVVKVKISSSRDIRSSIFFGIKINKK